MKKKLFRITFKKHGLCRWKRSEEVTITVGLVRRVIIRHESNFSPLKGGRVTVGEDILSIEKDTRTNGLYGTEVKVARCFKDWCGEEFIIIEGEICLFSISSID